MKQLKIIIMTMMVMCLFTACNSDDDENIVDSAGTEVNVLHIRSDNGKTSMGTMYKSGETYNPPHCYIEKGIVYNDGNPLEPTSRDRMSSTCLISPLKVISQ